MLLLSPNLKRKIEVSNLCKEIISTEQGVLQVSFINRNGRMIETELNDSLKSSGLTKQESVMLSMQCTLQFSMNREFEEKLTKVHYTVIKRESTSDFIFPVFSGNWRCRWRVSVFWSSSGSQSWWSSSATGGRSTSRNSTR